MWQEPYVDLLQLKQLENEMSDWNEKQLQYLVI